MPSLPSLHLFCQNMLQGSVWLTCSAAAHLCNVVVDHTQSTAGQLLWQGAPEPLNHRLCMVDKYLCKVTCECCMLTPPMVGRLQKGRSFAKPFLTVGVFDSVCFRLQLSPSGE